MAPAYFMQNIIFYVVKRLQVGCPDPCGQRWKKGKKESESHSVIPDSLWSCVLYSTWNSPGQNTGVRKGDLPNPEIEPRSPALLADSLPAEPPGKSKNTGVDSLSLLQGILPTQESNRGLLYCRQILYQLSYQGSPHITKLNLNICYFISEITYHTINCCDLRLLLLLTWVILFINYNFLVSSFIKNWDIFILETAPFLFLPCLCVENPICFSCCWVTWYNHVKLHLS